MLVEFNVKTIFPATSLGVLGTAEHLVYYILCCNK